MARTGRSQGLAGAVFLAVLVGLCLSLGFSACSTPRSLKEAAPHAGMAPGQPCTSCKSPLHDYSHAEPYLQGDCRLCHALNSWTAVSYRHSRVEFNQGFHALITCAHCHTATTPFPSPDCLRCHSPRTHPVLEPCQNCHDGRYWFLQKPVPEGHVSTSGGHSVLTCFDCHSGERAFVAPKACVDCHGVQHGGLRDCERCHDPQLGWKLKRGFDHDSIFVLTGRHADLACAKCHPRYRFVGVSPTCGGCHGIKHGGLVDCGLCHTTSAFLPSTFRHSSVFALTGRHASLSCSACHPQRRFASSIGQAWICSSCHGTRHGGLTDCGWCHSTSTFDPSLFRHRWVWPLSGRHAYIACSSCHPSNLYARHIGTAGSCVSCHGKQHGGLSACASCHTTSSFRPSTFLHSSVWSLTGKHRSVACLKCHPGLRYASAIGSPSRCTNCHGIAHGNQSACEKCHTTGGFSPAKQIAHPVPPPLGGHHASVAYCTDCHPTVVFNAPVKPCSDCHGAPHVNPTDCLRCHKPTVWSAVDFTHSDIAYHTQFPYEQACPYCHTAGDYGQYRCDGCHYPY